MKKEIVYSILMIFVIAMLVCFAIILVNGTIRGIQTKDIDSREADPMFAEPIETVTRPPELDMEEVQPDHPTLDDHIDDVQTPVERTAEELAAEADSTSGSGI